MIIENDLVNQPIEYAFIDSFAFTVLYSLTEFILLQALNSRFSLKKETFINTHMLTLVSRRFLVLGEVSFCVRTF